MLLTESQRNVAAITEALDRKICFKEIDTDDLAPVFTLLVNHMFEKYRGSALTYKRRILVHNSVLDILALEVESMCKILTAAATDKVSEQNALGIIFAWSYSFDSPSGVVINFKPASCVNEILQNLKQCRRVSDTYVVSICLEYALLN